MNSTDLPPTSSRPAADPAHRRSTPRRRRIAVAVLAGVGTFGFMGASAATLGGVTAASLGTDAVAIGSCDTNGVAIAYTNTYDATLGRYQTTGVTVSGIAATCAGKSMSVTLKDTANAALASGTLASISGTSGVITFTAPGANAANVVGAAVIISG